MKRIAIAAAVVAAAALGSLGAAQADSVRVGVGPNGIYVGSGHHDGWRHRHYRDTYGWGGGCRVIVRTHWRHGHRVTVRERVCR